MLPDADPLLLQYLSELDVHAWLRSNCAPVPEPVVDPQ
jgi:hypothetical protein